MGSPSRRLRGGKTIGAVLTLSVSALSTTKAPAASLAFAFADPINDHTGAIDVTRMEVVFDDATGNYEINLTADPAHPFVGTFDVIIGIFNPNTGTIQQDPSFFGDVRIGIEVATPRTILTLLGSNARLKLWRVNDPVAASSAPFGTPSGFQAFRSAVLDPGAGFGDAEDTIAAQLNDVGVIAGDAAMIRLAAPAVVARFPGVDAVVNRVDGVTEVVVQYERPVTLTRFLMSGLRSGIVSGASLTGNGTTRHRFELAEPLRDRERFTVTLHLDQHLIQWDFVTLVGDCDRNGVVNIFDLARVRTALQTTTFDADCDFVENGAIDIFDLLHIRQALRIGAEAP